MSDYRYSVIPAAAILDPDIKPRDLKILALLGRHTNKNGWCRRSQVTLANEARCVRSTVQASLDRLVKSGYVQIRLEGVKGKAAPEHGTQPYRSHSYRVLLDLDDQEIQRAAARGARKIGHLKNRHAVPSEGPNSVENADELRSAPSAEDLRHAKEPDFFEDSEYAEKSEVLENDSSSAPIELSPYEPSPLNLNVRSNEKNSDKEVFSKTEQGFDREPCLQNYRSQPIVSTARFAEFQASWGTSVIDNVSRTVRAWCALTIEQRQAALAGIKPFKAELDRAKRTHCIAGWRYLEERRWEILNAATGGDWIDVKALSRDWWALLFNKIDSGEPFSFFVQYSLANFNTIPHKREAMPGLDKIARLEAYPSDGGVMKAWRPWLETRGIRVPTRDTLWVFLPADAPPPSNKVWTTKRLSHNSGKTESC